MLNIIENLFLFYDLNEDTIYKEMCADELTTFIMAYNDVLIYNNNFYRDLWDYNKSGQFYNEMYLKIKEVLLVNNIKTFEELKLNEEVFIEVFNLINN